MGTVSFVAAYSLQPGTTSVVMSDPGSGRIGDLHVLVAALKNPSAGDPTANNGFRLIASGVVGTGADGAGVGQIKIGVFVRERDAGALGNTTLSNGSANVIQGSGAVFRKDNPGTYWQVQAVFGSDTVSDTTFSATTSSALPAAAGDIVYLSNYFSAGVTPTGRGATFTGLNTTLTGIDSGSTANGNDLGVFTDRVAVNFGALTAPSVTTGSTAAATTGGTVHVLIQAVDAGAVSPPDTYLPDASLIAQADDTGDPALGYLYQPSPYQVTDEAAGSTPIAAADTGGDTEDATVSATLTAADTGAGTDTGTVAATITGADTGGDSEAATVGPQAADTAAGSESAQLGVGASDGGSGSESGSVGPRATDTGTGTDSGSIVAQITASDSGTGTDVATVDQGATPVSGSDSGAGTESGSVSAATSSSDTAASTQTGSISAATPGTDSGSSSQSGSVGASLPGADTSTGTQTATIAASLPAADTATATDNASITVVGARAPTPADRVAVIAGEDRRTIIETAVTIVAGEDRSTSPEESRVCIVKGETRRVTA